MDERAAHIPVLMGPVRELLAPKPGETVVDATVGHGGHALELAQAIGPTGLLVGLDVDPQSLEAAERVLSVVPCRVKLVRENFGDLPSLLAAESVGRVDVLLADLGVSSAQLDDASRGLSFLAEGPLDMRLDSRLDVTAGELVNELAEVELANLIYRYGEERKSRTIARYIAHARSKQRIATTAELAGIVSRALRVNPASRRAKIHPATRTFQALRIAVNDELGALERFLAAAPGVLAVGGRVGVISFHSLEDRLVKLAFRAEREAGRYELLTKRPVQADEPEARSNPRSRSAKLRVARRTAMT